VRPSLLDDLRVSLDVAMNNAGTGTGTGTGQAEKNAASRRSSSAC